MPSLYTSAQFADYSTASAATRKVLGLSRLSPAQAALVREAVARHEARQAAKSARASITSTDRLRSKLAQRDAARLGNALGGNYRGYDLGNVTVVFARPQTMPGISSQTTTKWVSGRRGYGHVTDGQTIKATLQTGWGRKVYDAGLAERDGLVTLSAELVQTDGDLRVYRATWVRQGRGYDLTVERGFIATREDSTSVHESYHSTTSASAALAGLRRKMRPEAEREAVATKAAATRQAKRERKIAALISRVSRWDFDGIEHVVVTRHDSITAGNCVPGTDAFIDRFAPGRDQATLGEIAQLLRSSTLSDLSNADLTLARQLAAACLVALRRDKAASRALVTA
jgi:hypothetical protein